MLSETERRHTKSLDEDQTTFSKNVFNNFKKENLESPGAHLIFKHTFSMFFGIVIASLWS